MYETYSTVIGTVITSPQRRHTQGGDEVISFRVASTVRYRPPGSQNWQDGNTLYLTVSCWRRLITGVGATIMKGSPVIVHGQLSSSQYTAKDGTARSDLEMRAIAIGPDLARCIARIEKTVKAGPVVGGQGAEAASSAPPEDGEAGEALGDGAALGSPEFGAEFAGDDELEPAAS